MTNSTEYVPWPGRDEAVSQVLANRDDLSGRVELVDELYFDARIAVHGVWVDDSQRFPHTSDGYDSSDRIIKAFIAYMDAHQEAIGTWMRNHSGLHAVFVDADATEVQGSKIEHTVEVEVS